MTYSCSDFQNDIIRALGVTIPERGDGTDGPQDAAAVCVPRIRNLIAQVAMMEPQPIETAPKGDPRVYILALMGNWGWQIAHWNEDQNATKSRPFWDSHALGIAYSRAAQPKLWVPMPAVIKAGAGMSPAPV